MIQSDFAGYLILKGEKSFPIDKYLYQSILSTQTFGKDLPVTIAVSHGDSISGQYQITDIMPEDNLPGNYCNMFLSKTKADESGIIIPSRGCAIHTSLNGEFKFTDELTDKVEEQENGHLNIYPSVLLSRLNLYKKNEPSGYSYMNSVCRHLYWPLRDSRMQMMTLYMGNHPNAIFVSSNNYSINLFYLCVRGTHYLVWASNSTILYHLVFGKLYSTEEKWTTFNHEISKIDNQIYILNFNYLVKNKFRTWGQKYKSKEAPLYVISSLQRQVNSLKMNLEEVEKSILEPATEIEQ